MYALLLTAIVLPLTLWAVVYQGTRKTFPGWRGEGGAGLFWALLLGSWVLFWALSTYLVGEPHPVDSMGVLYKYAYHSENPTLHWAGLGEFAAKAWIFIVAGINVWIFGRAEM